MEIYLDSEIAVVVRNDRRVAGYSGWLEIERLDERLGSRCLTRTVPGGAKAGNIEYARQAVGTVGNTLITLFDADMIAKPNFFLQTLPLSAGRKRWVGSIFSRKSAL